MSFVDVLLLLRASPERARSLFTVRAAISSARLALCPRRLALSLMCSYCRSRFRLDPAGISATSLGQVPPVGGGKPGRWAPTRDRRLHSVAVQPVGEARAG